MYYSKLVTFLPLLFITLHASNIDEINTLIKKNSLVIYGINNQPNQSPSSYDSLGISYNDNDIKIKIEGSDNTFKSAGALTYNPFKNQMYVVLGANYITQNLDSVYPNNISQYSGTLGGGYRIDNDLYLEVGSSTTQLNNPSFDSKDSSKRQTFSDTYFSIAKRIASSLGAVDTTFKGTQLYQRLSKKEIKYVSTINYYPNDDIQLQYSYSNAPNNISNYYSIHYGYFITEFMDNTSLDITNLKVGVKASFKDITNLSSYTVPKRTKSSSLKLHKLKDVILTNNMELRL